jgi:hypothetical protein
MLQAQSSTPVASSQTSTVNNYSCGPLVSVTAGASPFVWKNPENISVQIFISIGTITSIEYSPDNVTWVNIGILAGSLILNPGQWLRVTYIVAPTISYCPI